jgi:DNA-binding response OmpR family regulator/chromosome segregation ATPase
MGDGFTILFVDPDQSLIDMISPQLQAEGYTIIHERNGEDALFSFEQNLPQLVIVELDLEGLTGQELCAALKERTGDYFVPVLFISTVHDADDKAAGYEAGADDFIAKPLDLRELSARIRSLKKIYSIANRNQSEQLASTYYAQDTHGESALKVVADNLTGGRRVLRLHANGQTAFIATDRRRIIHARVGELIGRSALDHAILWSVDRFESLNADVAPNLDVDFDTVADWVLGEIDLWRLFTEVLVPSTRLRLHPAAAAFAGDIPAEAAAIARAFETPSTIDAVLRNSPAEWSAAAKAVADLYFRGFLLFVDGPKAVSELPFRNTSPAADSEPEQFSEQLEELQLENLTLQSEVSRLTEEIAGLSGKLEEETQSFARFKETEGTAAKSLEARVAELDEELMALKRRYAGRLKDLAAKQGDDSIESIIQQLSFDLQDAHSFAVQVQNAKVAAEKQATALRNELGALKYAFDEAKAKLEQLQKQQHSSGQNESSKLRQLQDEHRLLKSQLAESVEARGKLQEQLRATVSSPDDAKVTQLQAEVAALRTELADVQALNRVLEQNAQSGAEVTGEQADELREELAELKRRVVTVTAERDAAVRQMQTSAAESNLAIRRLELEASSLRNSLAEQSTQGVVTVPDPAGELRVRQLEDELIALREQLTGAGSEAERFAMEAAHASAEASRLQEEAAGNASRIAELESMLAGQQAKFEATLQAANEAATNDTERDGLEEEIALLKTALTEAMVNAEKYQKELEAAQAGQNEAASRLQADLFSLSAELTQAQATIAELEATLTQQTDAEKQGQPLEAEVAFLKAKINEIQAAESARQQQMADEHRALQAKVQDLTAQRLALEDKVNRATDPGLTKRMQAEIEALNDLLGRTRGENEALLTKLNLANASAQKNTLLIKAQDQADTIQTLKATLRQRDQELAALQNTLAGDADGVLDLGAADPAGAGQAEIEELKRKVDALRMSVLERDEEIVDLTSRLQQYEGGPTLEEIPD